MVAVDGGRYDVNILRRQRIAVYWEGTPTEVRRCSWFFKGNNDGRFTPYEENIATKLEVSHFGKVSKQEYIFVVSRTNTRQLMKSINGIERSIYQMGKLLFSMLLMF